MGAFLWLALVPSLVLVGCSQEAKSPPNLVLITLDTLRADRLGAYGYGGDTSPVLDSLAREGVRFEDAIAQATTTPASHASILTGLNPPRHGLRKLYGQQLAETNETLAEILRARGYATAAFVSALPLRHSVGLDQGFDVYEDGSSEGDETPKTSRAGVTNTRVGEWLSSAPTAPVFLWVHYFDPHHPYFPPAAYRARFGLENLKPGALPVPRNTNRKRRNGVPIPPPNERAVRRASDLYDAEIAYMDEAIGELLDSLREAGLLENTVIAYVADHGEHMGENGYWFGHWDVLDETARVPMVLVHPEGRYAGRVVEESVGTIDLVPTLLAWLGIDAGLDFDGIDLTQALDGKRSTPRPFYTEQFEYFPVRAVREGDWLLHHKLGSKQSSLYRRAPSGLEPTRVDDQPAVQARLEAALEVFLSPAARHTTERLTLPDEVREQLRALGYTDEARDPER